jgi:hypothetical protein
MVMRYENVVINNVTNGTNTVGEYTTTVAPWFETRGLVHDIANSLRISEKYRVYTDLLSITLNYTPNIRTIVDNQEAYSLTWRNKDWRISDVRESDDRQRATFMCYRNDPVVPV